MKEAKTIAKQDQAIAVTMSWLAASQIPAKKMGKTVIVVAKGGTSMTVLFSEPANGTNSVSVDAESMASSNRKLALETFWKITEAAGYGSPKPVDRGADLEKRIYGSEFFLSVARHTEFRHAPNLSAKQVKKFEPAYMRATRSFFRRNSQLLVHHGYEVADLTTFALVWTHIFAHKHYREELGDANERILIKYLRHRFAELWQHLIRQGRSQFPSPDTVHIALMGQVFDENHSHEKYSTDPRFDMEEQENIKKEISAARKRKAATKVLRANLQNLPHDQMVKVLHVTANSPCRDYSTRKEARRLLIKHAKGCEDCKHAEVLEAMRASRKTLLSERGLAESNERTRGLNPGSRLKDVSDEF